MSAFSRIIPVSPGKYRYCVEAGREETVLYTSFHERIEDAESAADRMEAAYAEVDRLTNQGA
jgi:hypothetical protein